MAAVLPCCGPSLAVSVLSSAGGFGLAAALLAAPAAARLMLGIIQAHSRVKKFSQQQLVRGNTSESVKALEMEADMLLSLMLRQLTASILDSYPGAQAACDIVCPLQLLLWSVAGLRTLPDPIDYTGPQVALQLLTSLSQPQPQGEQQQQQQQHVPPLHEDQSPERGVLAPSAPLLAQLLPLLTRQCLTHLQQHQEQQQAAAVPTGQPRTPLALVQSGLGFLTCLSYLAVVPAPCIAAAAAAEPKGAPAAVDGQHNSPATHRAAYALHAQGAIMAHACDIIRIFEAALRCDAALCGAATTTAAVTGAGGGGGGSAGAAGAVTGAGAPDRLERYASMLIELCHPKPLGPDHPPRPSPLVLLELAAGPGSQLQSQLYSLLATMVKLSGWGKGTLGDIARMRYSFAAAACAASALDTETQEPVGAAAAEGAAVCSSGNSAAAVLPPSVVILGRCGMLWAEQLPAAVQATSTTTSEKQETYSSQDSSEQQQGCEEELDDPDPTVYITAVQRWLAAGNTCNQLAAAGYAPLPVLQQLEQLATLQAPQDSPPDAAAVLAAAQQLHSTGLALCSFAVPCMCNKPGCTSMSGVSELVSVSARSCLCGGCRVARYCGRACQRAAWKQHKPACVGRSVRRLLVALSQRQVQQFDLSWQPWSVCVRGTRCHGIVRNCPEPGR